jgi:hypothetical protein
MVVWLGGSGAVGAASRRQVELKGRRLGHGGGRRPTELKHGGGRRLACAWRMMIGVLTRGGRIAGSRANGWDGTEPYSLTSCWFRGVCF